jgi:hypothetical protein
MFQTKSRRRAILSALVAAAAMAALASGPLGGSAPGAASAAVRSPAADQPQPSPQSSLTSAQRSDLYGIARDTWAFYAKDVDPSTHLPLDNLGPGDVRGNYTSAANIGLYLDAVVSANDLKLISRPQARSMISATLNTVASLKRSHGMLFQWYDTSTGHVIRNPGDIDCTSETTPTRDNCFFLSAVDNGLYASGLMVVRQALPELRSLVNPLISALDFSIFYDDRAQTNCNTNPAIEGNQPTGQM